MKEGRKRKVIISDVKITDAGLFKCTSNADETEAEVVVKCKNFRTYSPTPKKKPKSLVFLGEKKKKKRTAKYTKKLKTSF